MTDSISSKDEVLRYVRSYDGMQPYRYGTWIAASDYDRAALKIHQLEMAERLNVETVANFQKRIDELERSCAAYGELTQALRERLAEARAGSPPDPHNERLMKMTQEEWAQHLEQYRQPLPPPATHCYCGAQEWPPNCIQIEDSRGRLHTLRGCQPGAAVTKPAVWTNEMVEANDRIADELLRKMKPARMADESYDANGSPVETNEGRS